MEAWGIDLTPSGGGAAGASVAHGSRLLPISEVCLWLTRTPHQRDTHALPLGDWQLLGKDHRPISPHSTKSNIRHTPHRFKTKANEQTTKKILGFHYSAAFLEAVNVYHTIHQLEPFLGTGCRKASTSPAHLNFCRHDQVSCLGKLLNSNPLQLSF